ncbi:hypothetical protein BKA70DRAFT_1446766 [Coprinopsis sp. MPI-PUGE-AT-0042]|nr:hypothetical protein BKA70DRAFT_1446766 [Coprinopsis sp. MPI-PUGE-AT-0042]
MAPTPQLRGRLSRLGNGTFVQSRYSLRSSVPEYERAGTLAPITQFTRQIPDSEIGLESLNCAHLMARIDKAVAQHKQSEDISKKKAKVNKVSAVEWMDTDGSVKVPEKTWKPAMVSTDPTASVSKHPNPVHPAPSNIPSAKTVSNKTGPTSNPPSKTRRGGLKHKLIDPNWPKEVKKMASIYLRSVVKGTVLRGTSTGWSGTQPLQAARDQLVEHWLAGTVGRLLVGFTEVPCDLNSKVPTFLVDSEGRTFLVRTAPAKWLEERKDEFWEAISELVEATVSSPAARQAAAKGARGPHFACIIGHHRQYLEFPMLTAWHTKNQAAVDKFLRTSIFQDLVRWVNGVLELFFPGVAERYAKCVKWHAERGDEALFGHFFQFCVNATFPGQPRIHCLPHADWKNVIGVCLLVIYEIPGFKFDHELYSWLVIWECGVVIQLPPWVAVLYPSALFYHFNVDINQICLVTTNGEVPTPYNSTDITNTAAHGRGSLVFFSQASMFQASETGAYTVAEARSKGHSGTVNYSECIQTAFETHGTYVNALKDEEAYLLKAITARSETIAEWSARLAQDDAAYAQAKKKKAAYAHIQARIEMYKKELAVYLAQLNDARDRLDGVQQQILDLNKAAPEVPSKRLRSPSSSNEDPLDQFPAKKGRQDEAGTSTKRLSKPSPATNTPSPAPGKAPSLALRNPPSLEDPASKEPSPTPEEPSIASKKPLPALKLPVVGPQSNISQASSRSASKALSVEPQIDAPPFRSVIVKREERTQVDVNYDQEKTLKLANNDDSALLKKKAKEHKDRAKDDTTSQGRKRTAAPRKKVNRISRELSDSDTGSNGGEENEIGLEIATEEEITRKEKEAEVGAEAALHNFVTRGVMIPSAFRAHTRRYQHFGPRIVTVSRLSSCLVTVVGTQRCVCPHHSTTDHTSKFHDQSQNNTKVTGIHFAPQRNASAPQEFREIATFTKSLKAIEKIPAIDPVPKRLEFNTADGLTLKDVYTFFRVERGRRILHCGCDLEEVLLDMFLWKICPDLVSYSTQHREAPNPFKPKDRAQLYLIFSALKISVDDLYTYDTSGVWRDPSRQIQYSLSGLLRFLTEAVEPTVIAEPKKPQYVEIDKHLNCSSAAKDQGVSKMGMGSQGRTVADTARGFDSEEDSDTNGRGPPPPPKTETSSEEDEEDEESGSESSWAPHRPSQHSPNRVQLGTSGPSKSAPQPAIPASPNPNRSIKKSFPSTKSFQKKKVQGGRVKLSLFSKLKSQHARG